MADTTEKEGTTARETARTAGEEIREKGAEAAEAVKGAAREQAERAREYANERGEHYRDYAADETAKVASALRRASEDLSEGSPQERILGQIADSVADAAERMHGMTLVDTVRETGDFARRHPTAFLGGAALLGFAAARFLKASAHDDTRLYLPQSNRTASGVTPSGGATPSNRGAPETKAPGGGTPSKSPSTPTPPGATAPGARPQGGGVTPQGGGTSR